MSLVFLKRAKDNLAKIAAYIARESGHPAVAKEFAARLVRKCEAIAESPFPLGRERPELRPDIRSLPMDNYIIFFRYHRESVEIVAIIEGHRDIEAVFRGS